MEILKMLWDSMQMLFWFAAIFGIWIGLSWCAHHAFWYIKNWILDLKDFIKEKNNSI